MHENNWNVHLHKCFLWCETYMWIKKNQNFPKVVRCKNNDNVIDNCHYNFSEKKQMPEKTHQMANSLPKIRTNSNHEKTSDTKSDRTSDKPFWKKFYNKATYAYETGMWKSKG